MVGANGIISDAKHTLTDTGFEADELEDRSKPDWFSDLPPLAPEH
jgi:hypothetical protein